MISLMDTLCYLFKCIYEAGSCFQSEVSHFGRAHLLQVSEPVSDTWGPDSVPGTYQ